jgi:phosphoglycolate phosphatase
LKKLSNDSINKWKAIAFDVDGTIFSSEDIILDTYSSAFHEYKTKNNSTIVLPSKDEIMDQVGKPVKTIFLNLLPTVSESDRETISDSILKILCQKIDSGKGKLYAGVFETIEYIKSKKIKVFLASNGRMPYLQSIVRAARLVDFIDDIVVLDYQTYHVKGDLLKFYIEKYKLSNDELLMVGDRYSDFEAAEFVKSDFAFCEYGHANQGEIPSYNILLKSILDLKNHL